MARKLIDQEEAARILGVTPEEVGSLRDRKKLFPYRDGDQWKYKQEDLENLRAEMQEQAPAKADDEETEWSASSDLGNVELELNDDLDSILLSEIELGKSSTEGASTIIGKMPEGTAPDSDLSLASDIKASPVKPVPPAPAGDSGITLAGEVGKGDSGITLASESGKADSGISFASDSGKGDSGITLGSESGQGDSGVTLGGDTGLGLKGDSGFGLAGDSGFSVGSDIKFATGSEIGKKPGSSDKLFGSDALKLSDDELSLIDAGGMEAKPADGSKKGLGSSIKLGDEELEVVLGGKSDVTQSPADSGIQLISASDSGLSLDQPLTLGSSAKRLLDIGNSDSPAADRGGEIKADDDFLLTAIDETGVDESSDSGSQVIALDTDDELSSGMFAPVTGAGMLEEDRGAAPLSGAPVVATSPALGGAPLLLEPGASREGAFSTANVMVLAVCVVLLLLCGMMTFDLMRNMWSWDGPYSVNSSILESLGSSIGWLE